MAMMEQPQTLVQTLLASGSSSAEAAAAEAEKDEALDVGEFLARLEELAATYPKLARSLKAAELRPPAWR